jgi:Holliday junction resolvase RusA-like endonuclease
MSDRPDLVLHMPVPPSVNRMYLRSMTRRGHRNLTPEYKAWRDKAGWDVKMQLAGVPEITCRFNALIEVPISWRRDTDGHIKPIFDLLELVGVISNDGNQHEVKVIPTDRTDCMVALTTLPLMGGIRKRRRGTWQTSKPGKPQPRFTVSAVTVTRLRKAGIRP